MIDFKPTLSNNHELGRVFEIALVNALRNLNITDAHHNRFSDYGYVRDQGIGVDVSHDNFGYECKNLGGYVGWSWINRHITERFEGLSFRNRIVVVSRACFLSGFQNPSVKVVDVGFQVTWKNFRQAVATLTAKLGALLHLPLIARYCTNKPCGKGVLSSGKVASLKKASSKKEKDRELELKIYNLITKQIEKAIRDTKDEKTVKEWLEILKLITETIGANIFATRLMNMLLRDLDFKIKELHSNKVEGTGGNETA